MFESLLDPAVLAMLIPILVLIGWIVWLVARHRERMAMIEHGVDPEFEKRQRERR